MRIATAPGKSSLILWDDPGYSQIFDVTVDEKTQGAIGIARRYAMTWPHTCDEVLGVALTMPSAQQIDTPTEITVPIEGRGYFFTKNPTKYTFSVPIAGHDRLIGLEPAPSGHMDHDSCLMEFPSGMNVKESVAWAASLPLTVASLPLTGIEIKVPERAPDSEFQKSSMMELKRIAVEAGY